MIKFRTLNFARYDEHERHHPHHRSDKRDSGSQCVGLDKQRYRGEVGCIPYPKGSRVARNRRPHTRGTRNDRLRHQWSSNLRSVHGEVLRCDDSRGRVNGLLPRTSGTFWRTGCRKGIRKDFLPALSRFVTRF